MKVPAFVISIVLGALLSVQAWTLMEVVNLKVTVATLSQQIQTVKELAKK